MSTPEVFFRETIDINRYGNAVAEKYVRTYNEIILNAAKQLRSIDQRQVAEIAKGGSRIIAPVTRKRLRAIIKQSSDSLDTWWARSALDIKKELQGVAQLQSEFVVNELKKVTETGGIPINSVAISEKYADSVIMTDPSEVNIFTSKQFTEDSFKEFGRGKFRLTATQGASIKLPNGQTVQKSFRGIAESSAEKLDLAVRSGVFSGETLQQISRRLVGRLDFSQKGNVKQIAAAGGELTKLANHQIQTIVRTSVNQVTNQASMAVYAANKKSHHVMNMLQRWILEQVLSVSDLMDRRLNTIMARHHLSTLIADQQLSLSWTLMVYKRNILTLKSHYQKGLWKLQDDLAKQAESQQT